MEDVKEVSAMSGVLKTAQAGTLESGDIMITIASGHNPAHPSK